MKNHSTLLLKNVILDGRKTDVLITGNRFTRIAPELTVSADRVIDGEGSKALTPPFYNAHNHAAMTLLRGYADDLELFTWLNDYIWPAEAKLTKHDIYLGSKLAIFEMIRSGTVFFNDMYWHPMETIRAVEELGVRAAIGQLFLCGPDGKLTAANAEVNAGLRERENEFGDRIEITLAPHAVYTVSEPVLRQIAEEAATTGKRIHIHAAETVREVEACRAAHDGLTPIAYLDRLGILNERTILAHAVHLTDEDIDIIRERHSVIAHMPCSNWKLVSGIFPFHRAHTQGGCRIALGTDGCASNNNLSMFDEMKFAALAAKIGSQLPTAGNAADIYATATRDSAAAFNIDAGVIAEGKLADALLIDLNQPAMMPNHNLTANLVYSADSSVVDTVICNGRILMQNRHIDGEQEFLRSLPAQLSLPNRN